MSDLEETHINLREQGKEPVRRTCAYCRLEYRYTFGIFDRSKPKRWFCSRECLVASRK